MDRLIDVLQNIIPLAIPANMFFVFGVGLLGLMIWAIGANLIRR